eukprot:scaffold1142_cov387-Prasinococcus_capsulatus_cf.AAC.18
MALPGVQRGPCPRAPSCPAFCTPFGRASVSQSSDAPPRLTGRRPPPPGRGPAATTTDAGDRSVDAPRSSGRVGGGAAPSAAGNQSKPADKNAPGGSHRCLVGRPHLRLRRLSSLGRDGRHMGADSGAADSKRARPVQRGNLTRAWAASPTPPLASHKPLGAAGHPPCAKAAAIGGQESRRRPASGRGGG